MVRKLHNAVQWLNIKQAIVHNTYHQTYSPLTTYLALTDNALKHERQHRYGLRLTLKNIDDFNNAKTYIILSFNVALKPIPKTYFSLLLYYPSPKSKNPPQ